MDAVEKLLAIVRVEASVLRDGKAVEIPVEQVVPGDVILLRAGDIIPGDSRLLESSELFADEATLTGETYPAEKVTGVLAADTALAKRTNALFMGTHVVSGTARALVVRTGQATQLGQVSESLRAPTDETEFEHGVRHFGFLLLQVTLFLVLAIFAVNVTLHRHGARLAALLHGARGRADPAASTGHHQHQPRARGEADGAGEGHRETPGLDREPGQHGRPLLRQDRDPDRGGGPAAPGPGRPGAGERARPPLRLPQCLVGDRLPQPHRRRHPDLPAARHLGVHEARRGAVRLRSQAAEHPGRERRETAADH